MEDEVIENLVEETVVIEDGTEVENTEETNENEEFNPDEFEEGEETFIVGNYDISKYKESLGLDTPENFDNVSAYLAKMESIGLTQEQVEFMLELEDVEEEQPKPLDKKAIQEQLRKELTREESSNYKSINSYVANMLSGSELEIYKTEIMMNPKLVKIMNLAYKKSIGANKTGTLDNKSKRVEKQMRSMGFDDAMAQIKQTMVKKGDTKALAKELSGIVSDKEKFAQMMTVMGIN